MLNPVRFAIISDLHIALPHTVWDAPNRFHLVEVSIPAFEQILEQLEGQAIDFLLLPGDLVQHGERENHEWLVNRLAQLPFPAYVTPGNHDVITRQGCSKTVSIEAFTELYHNFGYDRSSQPYYHREIHPGIHLISLNSNGFDSDGAPLPTGYLDPQQLEWLDLQLAKLQGQFTMVMLHHNALEHLPGQSRSALGRRYMVKNARALTQRLKAAGVQLMLTGHLHVQDIAIDSRRPEPAQVDSANAADPGLAPQPLYEITTGSLVSYPHPYRILELSPTSPTQMQLQVTSHRIESVPDWPTLQTTSQDWMGARSLPFMIKLLTGPPLRLDLEVAQHHAPKLRNFWSTLAGGDANFDVTDFPAPISRFLQAFNAVDSTGNPCHIDNQAILPLTLPPSCQNPPKTA